MPSVFKELLLLKVDLWISKRFLINIFVKYRDCKVLQKSITECDRFKHYKVRQSWISKYDRFWITKFDKCFKHGITKCNGIKKCKKFGDYKLRWDFKERQVKRSTVNTHNWHLSPCIVLWFFATGLLQIL